MLAECIALGLFLAGLGLCIVTGIQILYALLSGLLCFSVYCLAKGCLLYTSSDVHFYKVDIDEEMDLAARFQVMSVPTEQSSCGRTFTKNSPNSSNGKRRD